MMKGFILFVLLCAPAFAVNAYDCLVIDNAHPISKTEYVVIGHNKCDTRIGGHHVVDLIFVSLNFYDADGYRVGCDTTYVSPLDAHEKFRHVYLIPQVSGVATRIKVDKID